MLIYDVYIFVYVSRFSLLVVFLRICVSMVVRYIGQLFSFPLLSYSVSHTRLILILKNDFQNALSSSICWMS